MKKELLNGPSDSKLATRNWNIINDQSCANYSVAKEIIYSTDILRSNCDRNDAYILVSNDITIVRHNPATEVAFKKCAPFAKCITKLDGTMIAEAEDLDLVMTS